MTHVDFWFDPVSPYAYLAFERLPEALAGASVVVTYRPVLFAAMLAHWGQVGPAELEPKRVWTYRHVAWQVHRHGIEMRLPARHPFNPLPLLRLAWACCEPGSTPSRWVCERVLHHVWRGGGDADDAARLLALRDELQPRTDPQGDAAKRALREATDAAIAQGVFGVPTMSAGGRSFWGFDALGMLAASIAGDAWFDGPAWHDAGAPRPGVQRRR